MILLMITNEEKEGWHDLTIKKPSTSLRRITSKRHGDFYYLNCLNFFRTEKKFKSHKKICKNKDFCGIVMLSEIDNILRFNQYMKLDKMPHTFMLTLNL